MKKVLNKLNFILGIFVVMVVYIPGMLIGEWAIIILKVVSKVFNSIILFFPMPYVRGIVDIVFEAYAMTLLGRAAGIYIIIFVPMLIFKKFTKININWFPAIFLLIPILLYLGGIRQVEKYAEIYDGIYFVSISLGFTMGTFWPLYSAYLYARDEQHIKKKLK